jgi:hypothetical protein
MPLADQVSTVTVQSSNSAVLEAVVGYYRSKYTNAADASGDLSGNGRTILEMSVGTENVLTQSSRRQAFHMAFMTAVTRVGQARQSQHRHSIVGRYRRLKRIGHPKADIAQARFSSTRTR